MIQSLRHPQEDQAGPTRSGRRRSRRARPPDGPPALVVTSSVPAALVVGPCGEGEVDGQEHWELGEGRPGGAGRPATHDKRHSPTGDLAGEPKAASMGQNNREEPFSRPRRFSLGPDPSEGLRRPSEALTGLVGSTRRPICPPSSMISSSWYWASRPSNHRYRSLGESEGAVLLPLVRGNIGGAFPRRRACPVVEALFLRAIEGIAKTR